MFLLTFKKTRVDKLLNVSRIQMIIMKIQRDNDSHKESTLVKNANNRRKGVIRKAKGNFTKLRYTKL